MVSWGVGGVMECEGCGLLDVRCSVWCGDRGAEVVELRWRGWDGRAEVEGLTWKD